MYAYYSSCTAVRSYIWHGGDVDQQEHGCAITLPTAHIPNDTLYTAGQPYIYERRSRVCGPARVGRRKKISGLQHVSIQQLITSFFEVQQYIRSTPYVMTLTYDTSIRTITKTNRNSCAQHLFFMMEHDRSRASLVSIFLLRKYTQAAEHPKHFRSQPTLISASRKNKRFSGLASANPRGSKFLELGSGPSAPRRPPANSIDKEEDRAAVEGATDARTAFGVTKALVEPTIARAEAANAVLMVGAELVLFR